MGTGLRTEIAIGIPSCNLDGDTFDTSLFTLARVVDLSAKVVLFSPTQVHAQKHLCPILGINSAAASMNTEDGGTLIVLPTQHQGKL